MGAPLILFVQVWFLGTTDIVVAPLDHIQVTEAVMVVQDMPVAAMEEAVQEVIQAMVAMVDIQELVQVLKGYLVLEAVAEEADNLGG